MIASSLCNMNESMYFITMDFHKLSYESYYVNLHAIQDISNRWQCHAIRQYVWRDILSATSVCISTWSMVVTQHFFFKEMKQSLMEKQRYRLLCNQRERYGILILEHQHFLRLPIFSFSTIWAFNTQLVICLTFNHTGSNSESVQHWFRWWLVAYSAPSFI